MKTKTISELNAKEDMQRLIKTLLDSGLVITSSCSREGRNFTYFMAWHENQPCYIQYSNFVGTFEISTVHIPSRDFGSGYGLGDFEAGSSEVAEAVKRACKTLKPWNNGATPKKYKNMAQYFSRPTNQILEHFYIEND